MAVRTGRPPDRNGPRRLVRLHQPMERPPDRDDGTGSTEHERSCVTGPAELPPEGDRSDDGDERDRDTDVLEGARLRGASGHAGTCCRVGKCLFEAVDGARSLVQSRW